MPFFRKKPQVIEAFQWDGSTRMLTEIDAAFSTLEGSTLFSVSIDYKNKNNLLVLQASGSFYAKVGWWITYEDGELQWYSESDFRIYFQPLTGKREKGIAKVINFFEEKKKQQHSDEVHCTCLAAAIDAARKYFNIPSNEQNNS